MILEVKGFTKSIFFCTVIIAKPVDGTGFTIREYMKGKEHYRDFLVPNKHTIVSKYE